MALVLPSLSNLGIFQYISPGDTVRQMSDSMEYSLAPCIFLTTEGNSEADDAVFYCRATKQMYTAKRNTKILSNERYIR